MASTLIGNFERMRAHNDYDAYLNKRNARAENEKKQGTAGTSVLSLLPRLAFAFFHANNYQ